MSDTTPYSVKTPHNSRNADINNDQHALAYKTGTTSHRPRTREVMSRYKASTIPASVTIRRFPTPNVDRLANVLVSSPKRAQSAERRRSSPTRDGDGKSSHVPYKEAAVLKRPPVRTELLWPTARSLSSSMQEELQSSGLPKGHIDSNGKGNSRTAIDCRLANTTQRSAGLRKPMPERKRSPLCCQNVDQVENSRPIENKSDWPGIISTKLSGTATSRSVDLSFARERPLSRPQSLVAQGKPVYGTARIPRPAGSSKALFQSLNECPRPQVRRRDSPIKVHKSSNEGSPARLSLDPHVEHVVQYHSHATQAVELASDGVSNSPTLTLDSESVSSAGTTSLCSIRGSKPATNTGTWSVRGTNVPVRFWQDITSGSQCHSENNKLRSSMPESDFSIANTSRPVRHKAAVQSESILDYNPSSNSVTPSSSPWSVPPNRSSSLILAPQQPLSPVRTSPYRNVPSPARSRGTPQPPLPSYNQRSANAAMMLNFVESKKGRKGLSQMEEAHLHRFLHNRFLQWHFANARADAVMNLQAFSAEKSLYNVCSRIFELQSSVTMKKIQLQQARQAHKLNYLLSVQAPRLEEWLVMQMEHSQALTETVHALDAAVLQVPVTGGIKADIVVLKDTISLTLEVMTSLENSIGNLTLKTDSMITLVSELAHVFAHERLLMEKCADMLALASALEVEECSLRTHILQLELERSRVLGHLMDSTMASDSVVVGSP